MKIDLILFIFPFQRLSFLLDSLQHYQFDNKMHSPTTSYMILLMEIIIVDLKVQDPLANLHIKPFVILSPMSTAISR